MNIIDDLKKNEKPFGLMSEEMQAKAREIGIHGNFRLYCGPHKDSWGGLILADAAFFKTNETYRLRPDYAEEPEIEECEILPPDDDGLKWVRRTPNHTMDFTSCEMHKDFIGFKFEGGLVLPYPTYSNGPGFIKEIKAGETKVLHATHVLMRKNKKA